MNQNRKIVFTACLLGGFAVMFGAFGAHGLKDLVTAESVASFQTGTRYMLLHAVVLLIFGLSGDQIFSSTQKSVLYVLWLIGILFFSGSIFLLVLNNVWQWEFIRFLGPLTPLGGALLIIGWFYAGWSSLRNH